MNNKKHLWHTVQDGHFSIDLAVSENTDEEDQSLACFQLYSTENGDKEQIVKNKNEAYEFFSKSIPAHKEPLINL